VAATSPAPIYLDHAATTPLRPEAAEAMARVQAEAWANPSSPHGLGRRAKRALEECRERIVHLLGGRAGGRDRLVFTSGATEANRLAILGLAGRSSGTFASSARDHASVRDLCGALGRRGWTAVEAPLAPGGMIAPAWAWPAGPGGVWATTLVCGQTGAIEDVRRIVAAAAGRPGVSVHVDAVQAVVTQAVSFAELGCDTLAVAPHKFEGPRGIGGLLVRGDIALEPVVPGPQEQGLRGGTEPVVLAAGFARALELAVAERAATVAHLARLRERFAAAFAAAAAAAGLAVEPVGAEPSSPHLLALAIHGVDRQAFAMAADLAGVCLGTGTACASGSTAPAPALTAMGMPPEIAAATVRFSFGRDTTTDDVDAAVARLAGPLARCAPATRGP
jgi:cysteine desulfurase